MMSTPDLQGKYDPIRNDLLATGIVENMAESSSPTTQIWSNNIGFSWQGKDPNRCPFSARWASPGTMEKQSDGKLSKAAISPKLSG